MQYLYKMCSLNGWVSHCILLFAVSIAFLSDYAVCQDPPDLTPNQQSQKVFLLLCDTSPQRFILLDDKGVWLHKVKEIEIKVESYQVTMRCVLYEGTIKPTTPEVRTWRLSEVRTISSSEFQSMIDGLQTDPEAVKKLLSKPKQSDTE